jgi:hypothetical protein
VTTVCAIGTSVADQEHTPGVIFIFFGDKNEEREKQHQ